MRFEKVEKIEDSIQSTSFMTVRDLINMLTKELEENEVDNTVIGHFEEDHDKETITLVESISSAEVKIIDDHLQMRFGWELV